MYTGGFDVMLYVNDFKESVAFYVDLLGFTVKGFWNDERECFVETIEEAGDPHFVELSAGGTKITLHGTDDGRQGGAAIYHFEVDDVDALCARLTEAGRDSTGPKDMPWGWRMSFARDPNEHVLGFYSVIASD